VWQTSDVQTVTLDGRPVSTHGALVLPAPLHSATYRLVATNGARRATAYLHVVVDALTTDRHAFVLARPDIATFAVRRRHGQRYAIWLVRHAVSVQLQGRPVASVGERLILPGASTLRLVARNDVGSRQSLLPLAPPGPTATPTARPTHTRRVRVAPPTTLYFAEGYTGLLHTNGRATFDESLVVQNTTPVTATVTITYLFQWGRPVVVTRRIGPHATQRESVNADVGPDKIAAAVVSSAARLTAERIIRRVGARGLRLGASSTSGTASLGQRFYLAGGHTSPSVQEYLAVANPGRAAAHVRVTLARVVRAGAATAGGPGGTFTVPAHRRATWHIGRNLWSLATTSGGLIVRSDEPIVVERVSYVGNGDGSAKYGATVSAHKS
jgi:hypothetical protein